MSAATQLDSAKKVCVLSFDEMKIRKSNCYDRASDSNLHPVNYVQVAMLRGKNYIFKLFIIIYLINYLFFSCSDVGKYENAIKKL